jgi:hypothetical protein
MPIVPKYMGENSTQETPLLSVRLVFEQVSHEVQDYESSPSHIPIIPYLATWTQVLADVFLCLPKMMG